MKAFMRAVYKHWYEEPGEMWFFVVYSGVGGSYTCDYWEGKN